MFAKVFEDKLDWHMDYCKGSGQKLNMKMHFPGMG